MSSYNLFIARYRTQTVSDESGYGSRGSFPSSSCLRAVRFQGPAFIMNANVHRDKPRKVSGW